MLHLTIAIDGKTTDDLVLALEEVKSKVEDEYTSGSDRNESGGYTFGLQEEV